jgi:hypothetical protein
MILGLQQTVSVKILRNANRFFSVSIALSHLFYRGLRKLGVTT